MKRIVLLTVLFLLVITANSQLAWLQLPDFPGSGKRGVASFSIDNSLLEVSGLSNGLYFLEAITEKNEVFNGRFIKD